ncbi:uncharacterized protein ARMOST_19471 [Armillaria ostoyae]|uniref:Uncharacterized protein n=1 Tax=Armillaria ostoyae TaxID=47428 RepID=A0A284S4N9_ARMOS|nr:uncharacterized protein ARMOST_19471 [Armillaria ostoyae]
MPIHVDLSIARHWRTDSFTPMGQAPSRRLAPLSCIMLSISSFSLYHNEIYASFLRALEDIHTVICLFTTFVCLFDAPAIDLEQRYIKDSPCLFSQLLMVLHGLYSFVGKTGPQARTTFNLKYSFLLS